MFVHKINCLTNQTYLNKSNKQAEINQSKAIEENKTKILVFLNTSL